MKRLLRKLCDASFLKFILVGVVNTVFGTAIMFILYNWLHFGYWVSSAANYILGSVLSYCLNKTFTFKNKQSAKKTVFYFAMHITLCYLIAYGAAKPLIRIAFSGLDTAWRDQISMAAGMCFFILLNYIGQRFIVFHEKNGSPSMH